MATGRWTAIVINYNGASYLDACLRALQRCEPRPSEVLVVDNASSDDSLQELHAFPRVNVLAQPRNLGFAGGANVGLAAVESDFAVLLNPDVEVEADFGAALQAAFDADERLGAAGPLLLYPDGVTVQHAGGVLERPSLATRHRGYGQALSDEWLRPAEVEFVTGGALALRVAAARQIGGFDERFTPVYYEDVDFCRRLRAAGWHVRYEPTLRALHHEGVTLQHSADYYHFLHANRLRFALTHLSPTEWRMSFVPAEIARLRHELASAEEPDWPRRVGASAIAEVARTGDETGDQSNTPELMSAALTGLREALAAARAASGNLPRPRGRWPWWRRKEVAWLNDVLSRQHDVNVALIAAFDTQERLNREQTALALSLALSALRRRPIMASQEADEMTV